MIMMLMLIMITRMIAANYTADAAHGAGDYGHDDSDYDDGDDADDDNNDDADDTYHDNSDGVDSDEVDGHDGDGGHN